MSLRQTQVFAGVQQSGKWDVPVSEITFGDKIGEGSMAVIVRATFRGNTCAAKKVPPGVAPHMQAYQDLVTEIDTLMNLGTHPNIVKFMGACTRQPDNLVLLEELLSGATLHTLLDNQRSNQLERSTVYKWSLDILRALDFLHDRDPIIIHRDVKPANLMINNARTNLKLIDFGMVVKLPRAQRGSMRFQVPARA
jgi:serine/threonine protein kinase